MHYKVICVLPAWTAGKKVRLTVARLVELRAASKDKQLVAKMVAQKVLS